MSLDSTSSSLNPNGRTASSTSPGLAVYSQSPRDATDLLSERLGDASLEESSPLQERRRGSLNDSTDDESEFQLRRYSQDMEVYHRAILDGINDKTNMKVKATASENHA